MNADSHYVIGASHTVCEDYARARTRIDPYAAELPTIEYTYALVSDGCSSSPDTDVGARLLTFAAEDLIARQLSTEDHLDGQFLALNAWAHLRGLSALEENVLDATLLAIVVKRDKIFISAHGDGVVMLRHRSGEIEVHEIVYMDGAPGYPSYHLNPDRKQQYLDYCPGWETEIHAIPATERYTTTPLRPPLFPFTMTLDAEDYDLVAIMSDGVGSFTQPGTHGAEEVPITDVLEELLKFKLFKGAFVKRRLRKFLKDAEKWGWVHDDDISMAAVHIDE